MNTGEQSVEKRDGGALQVSGNPLFAELSLEKPVLLVVIDTEEEFDWSRPFDRRSNGTDSISSQDRAHILYDKFGVVPTYVVDYPVALSQVAANYLRGLVDAGKAEFGTHCHPWVTPPHRETVSVLNSFHGNLPFSLEEAKIRISTDAVSQAFGRAPRIFKAGRYGVGVNTFEILRTLGYTVDCSFVPHTTFASEGGPNFYGTPDRPFFVDGLRSLLEVPLTVGVSGHLHRLGRSRPMLFDHPFARRCHLPGISSRLGLIERARLSPEGFDFETQKRLLKSMLSQGVKVFTMTYHSPSLRPGNTPYVRSSQELDAFLNNISSLLEFFRDELGGEFSTLSHVEQMARG
jgi:hypothetical protein